MLICFPEVIKKTAFNRTFQIIGDKILWSLHKIYKYNFICQLIWANLSNLS